MNSPSGLEPQLLDAAVALMGSAGRLGTVRVLGESMLPTLPPGSVLCVEFAPADLVRGDLLLFRQANYLAVHRLVGHTRRPDGQPRLRTRGDNAAVFDPPVDHSRVVGRVIALRRDGSWRDFRSGRARAYGSLLALHDFAWTAAGAVADRTLGRVLRKLRPSLSMRRVVGRVDAALLRAADRLLFRLLHAPMPAPPGLEAEP
jgi:signal peptidase I